MLQGLKKNLFLQHPFVRQGQQWDSNPYLACCGRIRKSYWLDRAVVE